MQNVLSYQEQGISSTWMRDIKNRASGTGETITKDSTFTSLKSQKGKIKRGKGRRKKMVSENFLNLAKNTNLRTYLRTSWWRWKGRVKKLETQHLKNLNISVFTGLCLRLWTSKCFSSDKTSSLMPRPRTSFLGCSLQVYFLEAVNPFDFFSPLSFCKARRLERAGVEGIPFPSRNKSSGKVLYFGE